MFRNRILSSSYQQSNSSECVRSNCDLFISHLLPSCNVNLWKHIHTIKYHNYLHTLTNNKTALQF